MSRFNQTPQQTSMWHGPHKSYKPLRSICFNSDTVAGLSLDQFQSTPRVAVSFTKKLTTICVPMQICSLFTWSTALKMTHKTLPRRISTRTWFWILSRSCLVIISLPLYSTLMTLLKTLSSELSFGYSEFISFQSCKEFWGCTKCTNKSTLPNRWQNRPLSWPSSIRATLMSSTFCQPQLFNRRSHVQFGPGSTISTWCWEFTTTGLGTLTSSWMIKIWPSKICLRQVVLSILIWQLVLSSYWARLRNTPTPTQSSTLHRPIPRLPLSVALPSRRKTVCMTYWLTSECQW